MDVLRRLDVCVLMLVALFPVNSSSQLTAYVGGDVLLPCVHTDVSGKVSVFWRDKDDNNVLDIEDKAADLSSQSPMFRGRVTSFPDVYETGNFSIVLSKLQKSDSGVYQCDVPRFDYTTKVDLTVSDEPVVKVASPRPTTTAGPSGAASLALSLHLTLISVPLALLLSP